MRYSLFIIAIILFSCQEKKEKLVDCSHLKTGKFSFREKTTGSEFTFTRNDTLQVEIEKKTGITNRFKVNWLSPCEYVLTAIDSFYAPSMSDVTEEQKAFMERVHKIPLNVKILKANQVYYTFEAKKEGMQLILRDTIWILE